MKLGRILMVLCIAAAIVSCVSGVTGTVYAKTGIDNTEAQGGKENTEGKMPDNTGKTQDKGSPLHAWKAIVAAGKKAGDTITSKEFAGMRNWSASTRGYELRSLVAIGVLAPTGTKSEYKLLVDVTPEQIDLINEEAKPIVNKISRDETKTALGIDTWILDDKHLGEGKVEQIAAVVKKATGSNVVSETVSEDFVKEDMDTGVVPASAVINNDDTSFAINGIGMDDRVLLAALIDTRMVSPEAKMKGDVADFSAAKVKTVMFKEEFVADRPNDFKAEFDKLGQDETAVIIAINKSNEEISMALDKAGLLGQLGNRIVVMGVKINSPAAQAFGRLFGDNNMIDLRGQAIKNIFDNRDLVEGLKGTV